MPEWAGNPLLWAVAAATVAGLIFGAGTWVGAVNSDRAAFKEFMTEVRDDIKEILQRLPARTVTGGSPLRLTDLGKRISERLGAASMARDLASGLREQAAGKPGHEIQEMCFDYVENRYAPPGEVDALIRECAYENGIEREQVLRAIAVELRDRLLQPRAE